MFFFFFNELHSFSLFYLSPMNFGGVMQNMQVLNDCLLSWLPGIAEYNFKINHSCHANFYSCHVHFSPFPYCLVSISFIADSFCLRGGVFIKFNK